MADSKKLVTIDPKTDETKVVEVEMSPLSPGELRQEAQNVGGLMFGRLVEIMMFSSSEANALKAIKELRSMGYGLPMGERAVIESDTVLNSMTRKERIDAYEAALAEEKAGLAADLLLDED